MYQKWSYSRLSNYEKCPYRLVLMAQHKTEPNEYMQRGIELHKAIEDYLNDIADLPSLTYFQDTLTEIKSRHAQAEVKWGVTPDWQPCAWEDAWGRFIIDSLIPPPDQYDYVLIIDFKTGKPNKLSHQDQAQMYACAASAFYPNQEIVTQFWYLDKGSSETTSFTPTQIDHYKKIISARANKMLTDSNLRPRPNKWVCNYCNVREFCEFKAN